MYDTSKDITDHEYIDRNIKKKKRRQGRCQRIPCNTSPYIYVYANYYLSTSMPLAHLSPFCSHFLSPSSRHSPAQPSDRAAAGVLQGKRSSHTRSHICQEKPNRKNKTNNTNINTNTHAHTRTLQNNTHQEQQKMRKNSLTL